MTNVNRYETYQPQFGFAFAFIVLLFASSVSLKYGVGEGVTGEPAFYSDPTRLLILGLAYLIAVAYSQKHLGRIISGYARVWPYTILLGYILSSMLWSAYPVKVVISFGHYFGFSLVAMSAVQYFRNNILAMYRVFSFVSGVTVIVSIIASLLFPAIGVHEITGRWQGVCGNPNTLGLISLISVWSGCMVLLRKKAGEGSAIFIIGVLSSFIALFGTKSTTSTLITAVIVLALVLLLYRTEEDRPISVSRIVVLMWVLSLLILAVLAFHPELLTIDSILGEFGKDRTLTGRTSLWGVGWDLVIAKPYLGWSFDALQSAFQEAKIAEGQFHNGYLDFLIRGGVVGAVLLVLIILKTIGNLRVLMKYDSRNAIGMLVMIIAILVHNIAEASIVRGTHIFWLIFLLIYILSAELRYGYQTTREVLS